MPMHIVVKSPYCKQNELLICWYLCVFHTIFIPDYCFGLLLSFCSCLCPLLQDVIWNTREVTSCKTPWLLFPLSEHTNTFPWDSVEIRLLNQAAGVQKKVVLAQIITLTLAGMGKGLGKGTGKRDVSWCHLKLHTKLERKRQNQHSQSWVCGMQRARLKFPTLNSTEIVPLTCIPLSGNL